MIFWTVSFALCSSFAPDYIIQWCLLTGALKDFDKVDKKSSEGDASADSTTGNAAALADLPPGWNDEFLKWVLRDKGKSTGNFIYLLYVLGTRQMALPSE